MIIIIKLINNIYIIIENYKKAIKVERSELLKLTIFYINRKYCINKLSNYSKSNKYFSFSSSF